MIKLCCVSACMCVCVHSQAHARGYADMTVSYSSLCFPPEYEAVHQLQRKQPSATMTRGFTNVLNVASEILHSKEM